MAASRLEEMANCWQMRVHRVQQPEVRDIADAEVGQTLVALATHARQRRALRRHQFDESPVDGHQVFARADVQQRRNEPWVERRFPGWPAYDARNGQR